MVINVTHGDLLTVGCQVDGFPKPDVKWTTAITGIHRPGPIIQDRHMDEIETYAPRWFNETVDSKLLPSQFSYVVTCTAKNMQYNPPKGARIMNDKWNIQINIH